MPFVRPKRDQSGLTTPHFVTTRDSSDHFTTESSTLVLSDKQSSSTKEEDQLIPSSMNSSKSSPPPPIESECSDEINTLTSKIYQLPLPSNHPQPTKSILKKRSKSLERKPIVSTTIIEKKEIKSVSPVSNIIPISKRKNSILSNKSHRSLTKKQQQSLATVITTTPRSKYGPNKWDEPYIGPRFDPPTPPSSPSYFPWSQINDQNENETSYKLNFIDEIYF